MVQVVMSMGSAVKNPSVKMIQADLSEEIL